MAYKTKFLHFKTKASYEAERAKTTEGSEERKIFDAYISIIDEGPCISTWGNLYESRATFDAQKLLNNSTYASSARSTMKVGDTCIMDGMRCIISDAVMDSDNITLFVAVYVSSSLAFMVFSWDSTSNVFKVSHDRELADSSTIDSVVSEYVNDTTITGKTLTNLSTSSTASITSSDTILNALGKLQAQVNTKAATSSVPSAGTETPIVSSTAEVGTSTKYAREDHVHPAQTTVSGNAGSATKLATARTITLDGGATASISFDGSSDVTSTVTVVNDSHSHSNSTITSIDASKITSGTIDIARLPAAALERLFVVESQSAAMSADVQEGDVVQIGSGGSMYFCISSTATTFATKFKEFTAGSATSVPWSGVIDKPSTYTPSSHTHSISEITNLQTTLDDKVSTSRTINGKTLTGNINLTAADVSAAESSHTHNSSSITAMTGYSKASSVSSISTSDSLNVAIGKLEKAIDSKTANNGTVTSVSMTVPTGLEISGYPITSAGTLALTWEDGYTLPTSEECNFWDQAYTWGNHANAGYLTSIPVATSSSYGGIKIGYTENDRNYAVQLSDGKAYVNVPWENTIYTTLPNPNAFILQFNTGTVDNQSYYAYNGSIQKNLNIIAGDGITITPSINTITISASNNVTSSSIIEALGYTPANTSDIPEIPIALPNPYALTINGTPYTGSIAVSINTPKILSTSTLSSSVVYAGYSYNNTTARTISTLSGFSASNPDSVIISTAKLTFTASNAVKMDGLANLSGTYYIYCLSYMANGKIAVNGSVYA